MPEITLEWALRENGIDPQKDVSIDTSIEFAAMSGAFIGGQGDFVTLFEPNALQLEKEGYGHVVASVGKLAGEVPYTVYNARKSYIEKNSDTVTKFTKAIYKGQQFVKNNSSEEIAKVIYKQFPDTSMNDLVKIVDRYKEADSWYENPTIKEDAFLHIQEIMKASGSLDQTAPFDKLVDNSFAESVQ